MTKLFVFDLDGVLIDSLPNMEAAWTAVKVKHEVKNPFSDYKEQIGKPFVEIMRCLGLEKQHLEIYDTYRTYSRMSLDAIPLYDGVLDTLNTLKDNGNKIALCTSKARDTVSLLEYKLPKFDYISCPCAGMRGKPAPDQLLYTMATLNTDPSDTVYIGDMIYDQQAAERAGVRFEYASWGFGDLKCENTLKSITNLI
tara:strand:- start:109 stop:699 length:591 start_codon:yes stop_codon:yes gene_type:complete